MQNVAAYGGQARVHPREVFFTAGTALVKGQGVCYDRDRGTAGDIDETRDKYVELPSTGNHRWFAGVTDRAYAAKTGGQWVKIFEPGSVCEVAVLEDTVIDTGMVSCCVTTGVKGLFVLGGMVGPGSAIPLQTKTDNNFGTLVTGGNGATLDTAGLVLTHSGQAFLSLNKSGAAGTDIKDNSRVYIVGGEDDNTDTITAEAYKITSTTSATVLTVSARINNAGAVNSAMEVSYYAVAGNPTTLCYLVPGNGFLVSGCVEFLPLNNGASQSMVGGTTFYLGGGAAPGGDVTTTLADGAYPGEEKIFALRGAIVNDSLVVTVTSGGIVENTTHSVLATITMEAAEENVMLKWGFADWSVIATMTGITNG